MAAAVAAAPATATLSADALETQQPAAMDVRLRRLFLSAWNAVGSASHRSRSARSQADTGAGGGEEVVFEALSAKQLKVRHRFVAAAAAAASTSAPAAGPR